MRQVQTFKKTKRNKNVFSVKNNCKFLLEAKIPSIYQHLTVLFFFCLPFYHLPLGRVASRRRGVVGRAASRRGAFWDAKRPTNRNLGREASHRRGFRTQSVPPAGHSGRAGHIVRNHMLFDGGVLARQRLLRLLLEKFVSKNLHSG